MRTISKSGTHSRYLYEHHYSRTIAFTRPREPRAQQFAYRSKSAGFLRRKLQGYSTTKKIIINFQLYDEEDLGDDETKELRDRGWTIGVTKLGKRVWISSDDRCEIDNEEDCNLYIQEITGREEEERQREEEEWWKEEYYHRRRDPYWKNDSDYD